MNKTYANGQIVWLGAVVPQWVKDIENHREMWTGRPFLPYNGYGRVLTQFRGIIEFQAMVGTPNGCWDARVFRLTIAEIPADGPR